MYNLTAYFKSNNFWAIKMASSRLLIFFLKIKFIFHMEKLRFIKFIWLWKIQILKAIILELLKWRLMSYSLFFLSKFKC